MIAASGCEETRLQTVAVRALQFRQNKARAFGKTVFQLAAAKLPKRSGLYQRENGTSVADRRQIWFAGALTKSTNALSGAGTSRRPG